MQTEFTASSGKREQRHQSPQFQYSSADKEKWKVKKMKNKT